MRTARIKVIGVGGGGGNAVNVLAGSVLDGVELLAANVDAEALHASRAAVKVHLSDGNPRERGAGANPEVGRAAALRFRREIAGALLGAELVVVVAGMGGGTGTGGAPVVAEVAKRLGAIVVAVVTEPFLFEGNRRRRQAEAGIADLRGVVDVLVVVSNQRLLAEGEENQSLADGFKEADSILLGCVRTLAIGGNWSDLQSKGVVREVWRRY